MLGRLFVPTLQLNTTNFVHIFRSGNKSVKERREVAIRDEIKGCTILEVQTPGQIPLTAVSLIHFFDYRLHIHSCVRL
jgi:hypothetical protein